MVYRYVAHSSISYRRDSRIPKPILRAIFNKLMARKYFWENSIEEECGENSREMVGKKNEQETVRKW